MSMVLAVAFGYDTGVVLNNAQISIRTLEDAALVARAAEGDADAFEELVRRYRNDVYALCYQYMRNREEAWDMSQESFIKVYRGIKGFRSESSFKTWALRIAKNRCLDELKRRRVPTVDIGEDGEKYPGGELTPGGKADAKELGEAIERAMRSLPEIHRTAFMLRELNGLSYDEMAVVMQCNIGTVMSRLHHARKKLQQALREMGALEGRSYGN